MSILGAISPYDIKSIEVIKDGAGASFYGSMGYNGVIKIKTKRGLM
jgi:TonB-dependent SusC/RagA subfamily outer membrane receptor